MMVARGALWNASIFSTQGRLPWEDVKVEYVRKVNLTDDMRFSYTFIFRSINNCRYDSDNAIRFAFQYDLLEFVS